MFALNMFQLNGCREIKKDDTVFPRFCPLHSNRKKKYTKMSDSSWIDDKNCWGFMSQFYKVCLATLIFGEIKHDTTAFSNSYLNRQAAYNLRTISLTGSRPRTNYGTRTIHYQIISLCNAHPSLIKLANENSCMSRFKKQLKRLFMPHSNI